MAHGRYDLTEFEWKTIQPLLPNKPRGLDVQMIDSTSLRVHQQAAAQKNTVEIIISVAAEAD